ncbi:hypothetical protein [Actinocorallia populi]|uniref:hypothetical protein n=1 Tax=Actinocorallia populi TaxID=2079200 RepID=UPI000D08AE70|nr:hypothetical protein [Actinocorallia populi]
MRFLRLAVSLLFCTGSLLVLLMSVHGLIVFPSALFGRPAGGIGLERMSPGDVAALVLLYPLMSLVGVGNAVLLGWSGARGLRAVDDPWRWRNRQGTGLVGLLTTGLASLAAAAAAPPDSRSIVRLPLSVEVVSCLYLLYFSLLGLLALSVLLLDGRRMPTGGTDVTAVRKRVRRQQRHLSGKM